MEGKPPSRAVRLRGYDASSRVFLLEIDAVGPRAPADAKRREIGDWQALDRALPSASRSVPRLSLRRLKKLAEFSWSRDDPSSGWRRELQKNVVACEQWLEAALAAAASPVRLRFEDDDAYAAHHRARAETQQKTQRAKQLQQYFTSESLVQYVVERLPKVLQVIEFPRVDSDEVLWLEPSCGDGRIARALVEAGAKRVTGYELDGQVWERAKDKLRGVEGVTVNLGDFLASKPPPESESSIVLALGNPPFGSESIVPGERDLVAKFVVHVAFEWTASLVAFIVPSRCAKTEYVEKLLATLNSPERQDGKMWSVAESEPLEDCEFEFQETKRVKQPSSFLVLALHSTSIGGLCAAG